MDLRISALLPILICMLVAMVKVDHVNNNIIIIKKKNNWFESLRVVPLNARTTGIPGRELRVKEEYMEVRVKEECIGSFGIARVADSFDQFLTIQLLKANNAENR